MKSVVIGIHLQRSDIEPVAKPMGVSGLYASVFDVDDDRPLGDRELLMEIAGVRAKLLDRATFIAIRYGFTVKGEDELAAKCAGRVEKWRELLAAHREEVEMTLKVPAAALPSRPDRHNFESGGAYLRALHEAARGVDIDPRFRAAVERTIVPIATQHRWLRDASSLELAVLVHKNDTAAIHDAGERLQLEFATVPFLLSGPWPLEVFATDDHQQ
jgi:hypothetical protein